MADKLITAADISAGMAKRYAAPEWAIFFNVANGTGARGSRYADALAMSLFPSRGLELHGFEFKVSKSDYRREAADPEKAEAIASYCDRWWIVTPPSLLDGENIPPNWGWLAYDGRAFYTKHKAEKLAPKPIDRVFLAAILRRAHEQSEARAIQLNAAKAAAMEQTVKDRVDRMVTQRTADHDRLRKCVSEFEAASGIKLETWHGESLGRAVRVVQSTGVTNTFHGAASMAKQFRGFADQIDRALAETGFLGVEDERAI